MNHHPQRRKSKDNPYTLEKQNGKYMVYFVNHRNDWQSIEINEAVYQALNQFELDDIKQMHIYERHIEHSEIYEHTLYHRFFYKAIDLETIIEKRVTFDDVWVAVHTLSRLQRKRIKLYYLEGLSLEEIAVLEGTTHQAISKSIKLGIVKVRRLLKI